MANSSTCRCLVIALSILFLSPLAGAGKSSLFFESTYESQLESQGYGSIELSDDGSRAYASVGNTLVEYSTSNHTTIQSKIFDQEILSIALSPDDLRLALTLRDGGTGEDTIYVLDSDTFNTKISSQATASNAVLVSWTDNGASLLTNHPAAGLIKMNREDLSIEAEYTGNFSTTMTCADISTSGTYILGVDNTGLLIVWDSIGEYVHHEFSLDSSINDCSFDPNESMFSVSINANQIRKWTLSGSELRPIDTPGVNSYTWGSSGAFVHVHRTQMGEFLTTYDSSDSSTISEVALFHTFTDFEITESEDYSIDYAIFSSLTNHVVTYRTSHERIGVGESGSDYDGDGIPNSIDEDDDGDGIEDIWDLNCESSGSFSCELLPDEDYMRSMDLSLNSTVLLVKETFTLNKYDSSIVRDLSRYSLDTDVKLSSDEASLFATSYCANIHEVNYSTSIKNAIFIEGVSLQYISMECNVESGMELTQVDDDRTHIRYAITTSFNISGQLILSQNAIQILYQPTAVDGSITSLSEQHPISVSISGQGYATDSFSPWFLQEETITLSLNEEVDFGDDALVDTSIFSTWWFISIIMISILVLGYSAYKLLNRKDSYSIELNDDEHEDDDDESDSEVIEDTSFEEIKDIEDQIPKSEDRTSRKKVPNRQRAVKTKLVQNPVRTARRSRVTSEDSPVKVSKRRRLVETEIKPTVRKRRAVKQSIDVEDEEMSDALNRFEDG
ncbi:MAG: WD40 repeat domain-containing protein [Euryarchaeota archaeon]|nr:WD40 repeat domain-containing protein [Euryarchaeota archaeon]